MNFTSRVKKKNKHERQLVMARVKERSMHQTIMAVHQAVIKLYFGETLPAQLESSAVERVFAELAKDNTGLDLLALLRPLVDAYKKEAAEQKEAENV